MHNVKEKVWGWIVQDVQQLPGLQTRICKRQGGEEEEGEERGGYGKQKQTGIQDRLVFTHMRGGVVLDLGVQLLNLN